ncbi:hypothetical protein NEPAR04_0271 [Nematocida parisii]|nr:hypothetical protein NEPAR08_0265 [Nematocida parisii]KAI5126194.1 hypothetical protein NEPAR03_0366 [Nematocida parisii]KAI5140439.1 hypothetical protein NEPAR04_0271 [Nematocida parisii]
MDAKEQKLRNHIAKEFSEFNGKSMPLEEIQSRTIRLVLNDYRRDSIFNEKYPLLNNLAYNTFASLLLYNTYTIKEFNEDCVIDAVKESIRLASILIDSIERGGLLIPQGRQRSAFYSMLDKMHIFSILPASFLEYIRKDIFYALYLYFYNKNKSFKKLSNEDVMRKLCEINEFENCSNLDRVLDILAENIGNFTIYDNNGILQSNLHNLNLSDNDMYLLQLFASCSTDDLYDCISILRDSIFIRSKKVDEKEIKNGFKKSHFNRISKLPFFKEASFLALNIAENISDGIAPTTKKFVSPIINSNAGSTLLNFFPTQMAVRKIIFNNVSLPTLFSNVFSMASLPFLANQVVCLCHVHFDGIIKLGLYAFQEYEISIIYNENTNSTINQLCYKYCIDPITFKKNIIEGHKQAINRKISTIFSSPLNISLDNVLDESLNKVEKMGDKVLRNSSISEIMKFVDILNDVSLIKYPIQNTHTILINIEDKKIEENTLNNIQISSSKLSKSNDKCIEDKTTKGVEDNNSTIVTSQGDHHVMKAIALVGPDISNGVETQRTACIEEAIYTHGLWKIPSLITRNMGISLIVILVLASLFVLYRYEIIMFAEWITFS